jgi:hypothetical protein
MLIFYAGTFGYIGQLDFTDEGCCYDEPSEIKASMNISADTERLPSALMQLAEYYMAVRTLNAQHLNDIQNMPSNRFNKFKREHHS